MLKTLYGQNIFIGRETTKSNLCIAVNVGGQLKGVAIGIPGSVPQSVSRCKAGKCHCRLEIDNDGNMCLRHIKEGNVTYVNGVEIVSKKVCESSSVELGAERFSVDLKQIVDAATNLVGKAQVKPTMSQQKQEIKYSIIHLEHVWKRHQDGMKSIQRKQQSLTNLRSITPVFSISSGLVAGFAKTMNWGDAAIYIPAAMTIVGVVLMIYSIVKMNKSDFMGQREQLTDEFQDNYICPNRSCQHFMGNQPYKILRQTKKCPYCHCDFIDK